MMFNNYFYEEHDEYPCEKGRKDSNEITFDDKLVAGVYISFLAAFSAVLFYGIL